MLPINHPDLDKLAEEHRNKIKPEAEKYLKGRLGPLNRFLLKNLDTILLGRPEELKTKIIDKIPGLLKKDKAKPKTWFKTNDRNNLQKAFNYNAFTKRTVYGAYTLARKLNVRTCPYCNRQYTFTLDKNIGAVRPEFDHFYDKATYPYLALSFYNLIPSCSICNSSLKGKKQFCITDNIHPYIDNYIDDPKFLVILKDKTKPKLKELIDGKGVDFFYGSLDSFDLKIKVDKPNTEHQRKANNNIEVFKIEPLYNEHKDYVVELIQKAIVYNESYIQELIDQHPNLFKDKFDVQRMILANYIQEKDLGKRVLSKLTRDLWEDFKLDEVWTK